MKRACFCIFLLSYSQIRAGSSDCDQTCVAGQLVIYHIGLSVGAGFLTCALGGCYGKSYDSNQKTNLTLITLSAPLLIAPLGTWAYWGIAGKPNDISILYAYLGFLAASSVLGLFIAKAVIGKPANVSWGLEAAPRLLGQNSSGRLEIETYSGIKAQYRF